jgi:uncharacterized protein
MERVMQSQEMNSLLRIFIGEDAHFDGKPLYESIVLKAREQGLAGATVLRGPIGFGHSSRFRTPHILRISQDLPVIVEIVDTKEKITAFLSLLEGMVKGGLVTLEEIQVVRYGPSQNKPG